MRTWFIAAAASAAAVFSWPSAAPAQAIGQSCVVFDSSSDKRASEPVRALLEREPDVAVTTCSGINGVSHHAMSTVLIEPPGACLMQVRKFSDAGLASAAAGGASSQAAPYNFMAAPDLGRCPSRDRGRWVAANGVSPADFLRIDRFATDLAEGVEHPLGARSDRGCLKREARLRTLVRSHALISVRLRAPGSYSIELMRDAAGQSVTLDLRPDSVCVRKFGPFVQ